MDLSNMTSSQKDELMDQVKQQIAVANAQELLTVNHINITLQQQFIIS